MAGRTYKQLLDLAVVNFEYFSDSIQNRGTAAMTIQPSGAPYLGNVSSKFGVIQRADTDSLVSSAGIDQFMTLTGSVTFEIIFQPIRVGSGSCVVMQHYGASGGFRMFWDNSGNARVYLYLYDAAGALARSLTPSSAGVHPLTELSHVVLESTAGGTGGSMWTNGSVTTLTLAGAGVVANGPNATLNVAGGSSGRINTVCVRGWNTALSYEEAQLLYQNYREYTRPSKV